MSRRSELEKEIQETEKVINNAPEDTPKEIMNVWRAQYDSLSFELNNLYDDLQDKEEEIEI